MDQQPRDKLCWGPTWSHMRTWSLFAKVGLFYISQCLLHVCDMLLLLWKSGNLFAMDDKLLYWSREGKVAVWFYSCIPVQKGCLHLCGLILFTFYICDGWCPVWVTSYQVSVSVVHVLSVKVPRVPTYALFFFSYTYIPMIKFNL